MTTDLTPISMVPKLEPVSRPYATFGILLTKARKKAGITQDVLSGKLGVARATICRWEKGYIRPSESYEAELIAMFPELVGSLPPEAIDDFGAQLLKLRKAKGISREKLARGLCISMNTIAYWETGMSRPRREMLDRVEAFFGVSFRNDGAKYESLKHGVMAGKSSDETVEWLHEVVDDSVRLLGASRVEELMMDLAAEVAYVEHQRTIGAPVEVPEPTKQEKYMDDLAERRRREAELLEPSFVERISTGIQDGSIAV